MTTTTTISIKQLAKVMGVATETVRKSWLQMQPPCPHTKKGTAYRFDVDAVNAWRQANNITSQPGRPAKTTPERDKLNNQLIQQRITKLKLENDLKAGRLIDAEAEAQRDLAKVQYLKKSLQDAVSKWAADLDGMTLRERESFLKCEVNHLLEEFAR